MNPVLNLSSNFSLNNNQHSPFYGHYTGQPALADIPVKNGGFVGAKFYCPHALADGSQRIRIREQTLEFSSTVLCCTVSIP